MNNSYFQQQKKFVRQLEQSFASGKSASTVVDIQRDYANDDQICLTSVVFIPDEVSRMIATDIIQRLNRIEPWQYFFPSESMHITIKNIRTVSKPPLFSQTDIEKANELFATIVSKFPVFTFSVEDVVVFPTSISVMAYTNETLQKLVLALDEGLKAIGIPDDKKYISNSIFWGNKTICRFTQPPQAELLKEVEKMRKTRIGTFNVETVSLITCNAVCHSSSRDIIGEYKLIN